jgi:isopenicillin-N N-acyltransferase-like protein
LVPAENAFMDCEFPRIEAKGTPRQLGLHHGEQCREQILAFLDYLQNQLQLTREQLVRRALRFLPFFQEHCPYLLDEIHGLADGAGIPFLHALAIQIRGEISQWHEGGCTTFLVPERGTSAGRVLLGQNCDLEPALGAMSYIVHLKPAKKPPMLMWTFGGQVGGRGLNAAGVAQLASPLIGGPAWKFALPHYPLRRLLLEKTSVADIHGLVEQMPVCSNSSYLVCDNTGCCVDLEVTSTGCRTLEATAAGLLVRTSHFFSETQDGTDSTANNLEDSYPRLERIKSLLATRLGSIQLETLQEILSDHDGNPASICRHSEHGSGPQRRQTVASLIVEPAEGRMHIARGNPCLGMYQMYQLD